MEKWQGPTRERFFWTLLFEATLMASPGFPCRGQGTQYEGIWGNPERSAGPIANN